MDSVQIIINGMPLVVAAGISILTAARQADIHIPTLCYLADLSPSGACRICLVKIEGRPALVAACSQPVADGMKIYTHSQEVLSARKAVLELLLANHPTDCLSCARNLDCELQSLAAALGVKESRFRGKRRHYPLDESNPFIVRDNEKCILCGRCVRTCQELQGCHVLEFTRRGFTAKVSPAFDTDAADSECVFCGACVSACPVGALTEKTRQENGRATQQIRTTCPFCGVGCNFDLQVKEDRIIGVTSSPDCPVNGRLLCVKGRFGTDFVHSPHRLSSPLIRRNGQLQPASWEEALEFTASRFRQIKAGYGPDSIAALSSARCTNEENYLLQKFMRAVIGTNNIDHCART